MLFLNAKDLLRCLDLVGLQNCMERALLEISKEDSSHFPRAVFQIEKNINKFLGFMPGADAVGNIVGYKAIAVFESNSKLGINPHQGIVVLLDPSTGKVSAIMDGSFITAVRTAAVSAVATKYLSRENSETMAVIGAGTQALEHIKSISQIRNIKKLKIYCRRQAAFTSLSAAISGMEFDDIVYCVNPEQAIREADIVVMCTSSRDSLLSVDDFDDGVHLNAVGACRPGEIELDIHNRDALKIYLDSRKSCFLESEEILRPLRENRLTENKIIGELGQFLSGKVLGRESSGEITIFKSVGVATEDIFAADYFYKQALRKQIGQLIES